MSTLTPIEQLEQDITDLVAQRAIAYTQSNRISARIEKKIRAVTLLEITKSSEFLRPKLAAELSPASIEQLNQEIADLEAQNEAASTQIRELSTKIKKKITCISLLTFASTAHLGTLKCDMSNIITDMVNAGLIGM